MEQQQFDNLKVSVSQSDTEMGAAAAQFVSETIGKAIEEQGAARIIVATGASQFTFLEALKKTNDFDWAKVTVFHLDEYLGMSDQHPASFRKYLRERILDEVQPGSVHLVEGDGANVAQVLDDYSQLLLEHPIDIACIGIGENGHIAFNDPPVADFKDPLWIKVVELDEGCRNQQLGEGWFADLSEVPTRALTLTIPAIMRSQVISCVVPDQRKVAAVSGALYGPISESCPASILRTHQNAVLWLDDKSSSALKT